jgi:hypothetical protein
MILEAISNLLDKHKIQHVYRRPLRYAAHTPIERRYQYINLHKRVGATISYHNDAIIITSLESSTQTIIHTSDPELFPKILQVIEEM